MNRKKEVSIVEGESRDALLIIMLALIRWIMTLDFLKKYTDLRPMFERNNRTARLQEAQWKKILNYLLFVSNYTSCRTKLAVWPGGSLAFSPRSGSLQSDMASRRLKVLKLRKGLRRWYQMRGLLRQNITAILFLLVFAKMKLLKVQDVLHGLLIRDVSLENYISDLIMTPYFHTSNPTKDWMVAKCT